MDLTVIILNYNTSNLLRDCLTSIYKQRQSNDLQIWVVDNASTDNSREMVKKNFPQVKLIESDKNLGFAGGNNLALKKVTSGYALLLNSDTRVTKDAFENMISFAQSGDYGIVSCKLINTNRTNQANTGDLPNPLSIFFWVSGLDDLPLFGSLLPSFHKKWVSEGKVGWVSGTAMLLSKEVLDKVGLLDEALFMYAEDTDYCVRSKKAGFKIGWTPQAKIIHLGGGSLKEPNLRQWTGEFKGLIYLYKKYYGDLASFGLKLAFLVFIFLRIVAFFVLGRFNQSKTYAKVLFNI